MPDGEVPGDIEELKRQGTPMKAAHPAESLAAKSEAAVANALAEPEGRAAGLDASQACRDAAGAAVAAGARRRSGQGFGCVHRSHDWVSSMDAAVSEAQRALLRQRVQTLSLRS
jgi:hypothetical protein